MDIKEINQKIKTIKFKHQDRELTENKIISNPFQLFLDWFSEILANERTYDPCAMVLSTVDKNDLPDSRMVLLKEIKLDQFIFYSNYNSKKAKQLAQHKIAALNFYWPDDERQIRIRGSVEKVDREKSVAYFLSRPREAQLSAQAWIQSSAIANREEMDNRIKLVTEKFDGKEVSCPEYWGGYCVTPFEYEFFQGRKWRRHDRLFYAKIEETWHMTRLAP